MSKKLLFIFFTIIPFLLSSQDKKVLFLGNSYTFYNDLPTLFKSLAFSGGYDVLVDQSTPGGCTLSNPSNGHLYNQTSLLKITEEDWDYVILQEQSQYPVIPYWQSNYFYPGAQQLDSVIMQNNSCSESMLFMTWGREAGGMQCNGGYCSFAFTDFNQMTDSMSASYIGIAKEMNSPVSPVGMAWKNALASDPSIELFNNDGSHPSLVGSYLAACTFYASIFYTSPEGLGFISTLDETTASFLQEIAASTVFSNLELWNIDTTTLSAAYDYEQGEDTVYFTNQSLKADSYLWDFGDGTTDTTENPIHHYETGGLYNVRLEAFNSCDTASVTRFIKIIIQSTDEIGKDDDSFKLYPNPGNGIYYLDNTLFEGDCTFSVYSQNGLLIHQFNKELSVGDKTKINLTDLASAVYWLNIENESQTFTKKIVKM